MKSRSFVVFILSAAVLAACHGGGNSLPDVSPPQTLGGAHPMSTAAAAAYSQTVLGYQPIQYFQLSESAGPTAVDSSTTKVNGQYVGAVTYGLSGPPVTTATAISLPGTGNTGVSLPKPNVATTSSYTIATWVYPILPATVTATTQYMTIWGNNGSHRLMVSNTGVLLSQFAGNFFSDRKLTSGVWHQVVFVYNASTSTASYYIDGTFDDSATISNSSAAFTSGYYLGQYDTGVYYKWHGRLAQHAFFPKVLSASQISALYSGQGGGTPAPSPTPTAKPTATPPPGSGAFYDWSTYAGNNQNTGYNSNETTLSVSNAAQLHKLWTVSFGGPIDAQPIIAANVNAGGTTRNLVLVGAENGMFKAFDASTGAVVWSKQLNSHTNTACSDLPIWGITGTAAFNRAAGVVYVADGQNEVHALDVGSGAEKSGWPLTVALVSEEHIYSGLTYNPANGLLYVETAGYCDITPYQGRIVAINTSGPSIYQTWRPASGTTSGGGIWGEGGAAIDAATNDVFVATGNVFGSGYGESMVRLSSALALKAANMPSSVPGGDYDFSGSPMLYQSGSCPQQVDAFNKGGDLYTWSAGSIGSGPTQSLTITSGKSDTEVATYSPATHYIYVTNPQNYGSYNYGVLAFAVQSNCTLSLAWQKTVGISNQNDTSEQLTIANGVAYLSDGWGKAVFALNASNGALLWSSGTTIGNFTFAAPTVDGGHLYVGSYDGNVYAFGP